MTRACFANKWAELLPCLQTWDIYTWRNSCEAANELYTRATIADRGDDNSFIAFANINESPSRTKSWISKSLASCNPISKAFRSHYVEFFRIDLFFFFFWYNIVLQLKNMFNLVLTTIYYHVLDSSKYRLL